MKLLNNIRNLFIRERENESNIRKAITDASNKTREIAENIIKKVTFGIFNGSPDDFEAPPIDLNILTAAYDVDSYIRQAVDKYVDQLFKEGYRIYGKNPDAVDYIKKRFDYMAEITEIPTETFFTGIAEDIVKYANCFLTKVRSSEDGHQHPDLKVEGYYEDEPIAGYFFMNAGTVTILRDGFGITKKYKQTTAEEEKDFPREDIIHFHYKREKGEAFGKSFLLPVLDDVRALREVEQNMLRMVHKNINPFHHVQVGTKDLPGTEAEVELVKEEIENMETDGGLVTTERVSIKPIASDQVIQAKPYLEYLENRVFTGTGIPAIMFGRGDTANRSTGDSMTSEMSDRIKAIQKTIESSVYEKIIKELLLEGGYDPIINPEEKVVFQFNENDMDSKIKTDNHITFLFEHGIITEDEARQELGRDPIQDADREKLHYNLIGNNEGNDETDNKNEPKNQHSKDNKEEEIIKIFNYAKKNKKNNAKNIIQLKKQVNIILKGEKANEISKVFNRLEKTLNNGSDFETSLDIYRKVILKFI